MKYVESTGPSGARTYTRFGSARWPVEVVSPVITLLRLPGGIAATTIVSDAVWANNLLGIAKSAATANKEIVALSVFHLVSPS